jgi:hypothetical protein
MVVNQGPWIEWKEGTTFEVRGDEISVVFINSGNRPVAILSLSIMVNQPTKESADAGCSIEIRSAGEDITSGFYLSAETYQTDFEPVIVKEREVVARKFKIVGRDGTTRSTISLQRYNAELQPTELFGRDGTFPIDVCFRVSVATPSNADAYKLIRVQRWYGRKQLNSQIYDIFSDVVGSYGAPEKVKKPFEVYHHSGNILTD